MPWGSSCHTAWREFEFLGARVDAQSTMLLTKMRYTSMTLQCTQCLSDRLSQRYNAKSTLQNFQTPNNAFNAQCLHLLKILVPTTLNADNATMHTMLNAYV
jgi:hypothetical protein